GSTVFDLPPIVRADGSDNGFFVHGRTLFWQNEDTAKLLDLVDRRSFDDILALAGLPPAPEAPGAGRKSIHVRAGFTDDESAGGPLVADPISFAFGTDGKLWVVEMGDYPSGVPAGEREAKQEAVRATPPGPPLLRGGKANGGQIRCLEDTNGDGNYDNATVFL